MVYILLKYFNFFMFLAYLCHFDCCQNDTLFINLLIYINKINKTQMAGFICNKDIFGLFGLI